MQTLLIDQVMINLNDQKAQVASYSKLSLPVALIPAYKPEKALCSIARDLIDAGAVQALIVVNDGSPAEYDGIFAELSHIDGVHVLSHGINRGKGAALK